MGITTVGVKVTVSRPDGFGVLESLSYASGLRLPGGGVRRESLYEAARREIREELGLDVDRLTLLAVVYHPDEGREDPVAVLEAATHDGVPTPDGREVIGVVWADPRSVASAATAGTRRLLEAYAGMRPWPEFWAR
jgi:8-oxo-dGTP pyrophosphatase MutT (NUDIX family)